MRELTREEWKRVAGGEVPQTDSDLPEYIRVCNMTGPSLGPWTTCVALDIPGASIAWQATNIDFPHADAWNYHYVESELWWVGQDYQLDLSMALTDRGISYAYMDQFAGNLVSEYYNCGTAYGATCSANQLADYMFLQMTHTSAADAAYAASSAAFASAYAMSYVTAYNEFWGFGYGS